MSLDMNRLQPILKTILQTLGLLPAARWFRRLIMLLTKPEFRGQELERRRRERAKRERFLQFKHQYGDILGANLSRADHPRKKALVIPSRDFRFFVAVELALVKALELADFRPALLVLHNGWSIPEHYSLAGVEEIHSWSTFLDSPDLSGANAALQGVRTFHELISLEHAGARTGRFAVATALRLLRQGALDLQTPGDRETLAECLATAQASATAARRMVCDVRPDLLLVLDSMYSPEGELVDICLGAGIDVIMYALAHKSSSLVFKRYTLANKDEPPASLSQESWRSLRDMEWTDAHREQLRQELRTNYASGDWYSVCGTQFDKAFIRAGELRKRLGLDPAKKTAVIFPHISWDASMIWGEDLFSSYEEWFIETVRAACANEQVNWVIKIHPAHVGKNAIEGKHREPAEVVALRRQIGELPSHVFVIPAESDISTFSLFDITDYCLTVRGTVGVEAAIFGIPVLTAGTGRYDQKGFTVDSGSREQYLEKVAHIQDIPRLSLDQRELAERFAYGLFLLRPLPLTTVTFKYHKDYGVENRFMKTQINIATKDEWRKASDLRALAQWIADAQQLDFLLPLPEG